MDVFLRLCQGFFVKKELADKYIPNIVNSKKKFRESTIRESRGKKGELTFLNGKARIESIKELELVNTSNNETLKIKQIFL